MLRSAEEQRGNVRAIAYAWRAGDLDALERLLVEELRESPELYRRLIVDRHARWVPAVEACTAEQPPCFVVVGAAHLVGPDSLVALLRARGYTVERQ
jgi:uncharacterized protein YbaP (TraB family)